MAETYSAGIVTAYGAAVRGGYDGTYEQWCEDMAQLGDNVAEVRGKAEQVEQTAQEFTEQTVPAAIQSVEDKGTEQVNAVGTAGATQVQEINGTAVLRIGAVNAAGAAQVQAVEDAGNDVTEAVEAAGTAATSDIDTAKAAALTALQNESFTQQTAIQQKGETTRASIPDDYTALSDEVVELKSALDTGYVPASIVFEQGTIAGGVEAESTTRVRTVDIIPCDSITVNVPTGFYYSLIYYYKNGDYATEKTWTPGESTIIENVYYGVRIIIRKTNNTAAITPADVNPEWFSILTPYETAEEKAIKETVGRINVKDYAKGDGVTDDTAAIRSALVDAEGKTLYFPNGTYLVRGTLRIPTNTVVEGESLEAIIKLDTTFSLSYIQWRSNRRAYLMLVTKENSENVQVRNITIDGNQANNSFTNLIIGLCVYQAKNCIIENCHVKYVNYDPDLTDASAVRGFGLFCFHSEDVQIIGGNYHHCGYENVGVEYSDDVIIDRCFCGDAWRVPLQCHIGCKNIKITNCRVVATECDKLHSGFTIHSNSETAQRCENIQFIGNTVYTRNGMTNHGVGGIQTVMGYEAGVVIANNVIDTERRCFYNATDNADPASYNGSYIITGNILRGNAGLSLFGTNSAFVVCDNIIDAVENPLNSYAGKTVISNNLFLNATP